MQNYSRIYGYIDEYWRLMYDFYSKHGNAFPVTYYNIDTVNTVWDNQYLMGGSYEKIGSLSGIKWNKILLFPIYFVEETSTEFDAQDIGYINEGESGFVIPSIYGITPYPNDMVKFHQAYLSINPDINALYAVTGVQKQSPQDRTYWKCKLNVEQSRTTTELDLQVSNTYTFFDYTKKIYSLNDSITLTRMLTKNETLRSNLKALYDDNSGYYFI